MSRIGNERDELQFDESPIFGSPAPNTEYTVRRAAYAVIMADDGKIAIVRGVRTSGGLPNGFLPGGGSLPGEALEDTVTREVKEELARNVRLTRRLGEGTQYFYAESDDCFYKMRAAFFVAEFTDEAQAPDQVREHELYWLTATEAEEACFHACHAWAVQRAVAENTQQRVLTIGMDG